jgi:hypothetical protein
MGTDPEIFIIKNKVPVVPESLGLKNIKKTSMERVVRTRQGYDGRRRSYTQRARAVAGFDNGCVEFNVQPAGCLQELNRSIQYGIRDFYTASLLKDKIKYLVRAAIEFDTEDIRKFKSLQEFACSPAFNVQGGNAVPCSALVDPLDTSFRSSGYHVHIGAHRSSTKKKNHIHNEDLHPKLAQMCDLLLGVPAVLLDRDESNFIRRNVIGYGRAGEFRSQKHGFEYRTLSAWPFLDPMWTWWAHASVRDAWALLSAGYDFTTDVDMLTAEQAINMCDGTAAKEVWAQVKTLLNKHVWKKGVVRPYHATGRTVYLVANPVSKLEYFMSVGIRRNTLEKLWLKNREGSSYHRGFPSASTRLITGKFVPHKGEYVQWQKRWTPTRSWVTTSLRPKKRADLALVLKKDR